MAIYSNSKGTLSKSFKFGPNGIALSTKAVVDNGTGELVKSLVRSDVLENGKHLRVVFEREDQPITDRFNAYISSDNIKSIQALSTGGIRIFLKNWEENNLPEYFDVLPNQNPSSSSGDVVGPDSAINNDIAVFDGTSGKAIKDSNYSILNNNNIAGLIDYDEDEGEIIIDSSVNNTIPTTGSILQYIGVLDETIKRRLDGTL